MTLCRKLNSTSFLLGLIVLWGCPGLAQQPAPAKEAASPPSLTLSLAEAVKLGQTRNPLPQEANARVSGAVARLQSAGALPNPAISLAQWAGQQTGGLDEDVFLIQTIPVGDKRGQRMRSARFERDSTLFDRDQTALDVSLAVKAAYYSALRSDVDYQVASELLAITKQFGEAAKTQYAAGDVARSNVVRSEVEVSRAEQDLTVTERQRADSYSTLRSLLVVPESTELTLSDKLAFASASYQLSDLETLALRQRPDLRAEKLTRDSLDASVHAAKVQSQPDAFIEYRQFNMNPNDGVSVRAGLTWPLIDLGLIRADVASAQAALKEQDAKLAEATRVAKLEVETALHALDQARKVVESFETGRIVRAKDLLDMVQTGYDKGASSYLDVLDAQRAYRSELADYARALADYNTALATLERAVGGKLK
jgi:outer membrane protein TolC